MSWPYLTRGQAEDILALADKYADRLADEARSVERYGESDRIDTGKSRKLRAALTDHLKNLSRY